MKLSDYVIDVIVQNDVHHIFEMIGGGIAHLLDSTYHRSDIECVSVRHEQAAAFAAEAYARTNGKLGVALATSGPGALNLTTGIGSCYFDSVPCLFITGQVNTYEYKFDNPIRQIGFQETDIVSVVKPITKYAVLISKPERIRYELEKAIYLAQNNRPGPVLLDIPMNIQRASIDIDSLESFFTSDEYKKISKQSNFNSYDLNETLELLRNSKRPIILAGGGIRTANATKELDELLSITNIPVVSSLMGIDSINHERNNYFGLIGSYGNRYSNLALANSDLILILGSRLDSRQTGTRVDTFGRAAKKIHIDIDPLELNAKVKVDLAIRADLKNFLQTLNEELSKTWVGNDLTPWYETIQNYKKNYSTSSFDREVIDPNWFMEELSSLINEETIVLDVGQHQMWASQSLKLKEGQRLLNSGGMGAMGFALPAAIGASLAGNLQRVIVIVGDGGMQVNIQELDTIVSNEIPILIIIMNNNSLGMVRQFQDLYFDKRRQSTIISKIDFCAIGEAYGINSFNINCVEDVNPILKKVFMENGSVIVNVSISLDAIVNPKLVVNRPIEDMSPHLNRDDLKRLMLIDLVEEMDIPK